jgi:hypothetical protein
MQVAMHPQMIAGAAKDPAGQNVAPNVVMMPFPQPMMQMASSGGARPDGSPMAMEQVGPALMPLQRSDPNQQYGAVPFMMPGNFGPVGAYPASPQHFQPSQPSQPAEPQTFRDLCSPTYQSSEAYEQYVRDIMNADGDEFQFR